MSWLALIEIMIDEKDTGPKPVRQRGIMPESSGHLPIPLRLVALVVWLIPCLKVNRRVGAELFRSAYTARGIGNFGQVHGDAK